MVIPHIYEWPARAGVLQVGILQVSAVYSAIIVYCRWDMEIVNLLTMFVAHDVTQPPVVHPLRPVFRVPDDFVDEIAEVQYETQSILLRRALIFKDHPAISILS